MKRFALVVFAICGLVVLSACGGSDDSASGGKDANAGTPAGAATPVTATVAPAATLPAPSPTPLAFPECKGMPPLPEAGVRITPPPAGLSPALAAFSGAWEGTWGGSESQLVVQTVNATDVAAVYLFNGVATGPMLLKVQPDGKLSVTGFGVTFVWTMAPDMKSIQGERTQNNQTIRGTMTRCTALAAKPLAPAAGQQYPACRLLPPLPPQDLQVTAPAAGLPANLAAFSGAWEGWWVDVAASAVIVKTISATEATLTYVFGGVVQPAATYRVGPDGKISLGTTIVLAFAVSPDGKTLTGTRTQNNATATATMTRCVPS